MGYCGSAALSGDLCQSFRLQSAFRADAQWVGLAAKNVARNQVLDDGCKEILFRVDQYMLNSTKRHRPLFERDRRSCIDTTRIDAGRDDVTAVIFLQPRYAERCVEAA